MARGRREENGMGWRGNGRSVSFEVWFSSSVEHLTGDLHHVLGGLSLARVTILG